MTAISESARPNVHPILTRALEDADYITRLQDNPRAALEEVVGPLPEDVEYRLVRDTANVRYLHIPQPPSEDEISDVDLLSAQGGTTPGCVTFAMISLTAASAVGTAVSISLDLTGTL
ncbi:hypothetical protein Q5Y75_12885 [Ruegeria sp. 2205SS24-7]|uniref:hypothetical protein n=1 Tax=Ruegeria discodermiae TaxID=3064389 RepID=UPI002740AAE8|nr:hypothetical protein [Ruegeria sp. 2205SS24-7]MDP5218118.1 hypothetical protein [Ruegeria sp. 2205SS24-7]